MDNATVIAIIVGSLVVIGGVMTSGGGLSRERLPIIKQGEGQGQGQSGGRKTKKSRRR